MNVGHKVVLHENIHCSYICHTIAEGEVWCENVPIDHSIDPNDSIVFVKCVRVVLCDYYIVYVMYIFENAFTHPTSSVSSCVRKTRESALKFVWYIIEDASLPS